MSLFTCRCESESCSSCYSPVGGAGWSGLRCFTSLTLCQIHFLEVGGWEINCPVRGSDGQANTDPEFSLRSSDRQTDGGEADFSDEGVDA